jgi:uncharacterized membrane protein HdeD (DUF308 family)
VKESAVSDRWPLLPQFVGLTIGIVIIASIAIGVIFLAQSLGASGRLLIAIGGVVSIAAAFVMRGAFRS